jgi:hypothetical protein
MGRTKQTSRKDYGGKVSNKTVAFQYAQQTNSSTKVVAIENDVSYESSFYAHYFNTGEEREREFAPAYQVASVENVMSGQRDNWLVLSFNSKYDGENIKSARPRLNLVIVLDISGSMSLPFAGEREKKKIKVAQESMMILLSQLQPDDSLGFVVFNNAARVVQPLKRWGDIDRDQLERYFPLAG